MFVSSISIYDFCFVYISIWLLFFLHKGHQNLVTELLEEGADINNNKVLKSLSSLIY